MPETLRPSLIEAAHLLLEGAIHQPAREDYDGSEIQALYKVLRDTRKLLLEYGVGETVPELREGAQSAATHLQRGQWLIEGAWLERYSAMPLRNVVSMPIQRAS